MDHPGVRHPAAAACASYVVAFRPLRPRVTGGRAAGSPGWTVEERGRARQCAAAVSRAVRRSPLPALCLVQALALRAMRSCRGLNVGLHLSAGSERGGCLSAHAWVSLGRETFLSGGTLHGKMGISQS
ncbi:lasso peptide biosynthesis B2 protein [Azospirillum sp. B506]|uniref:lasso peptide biosynthesis B2 protein n=1 Tax=Azospirillum sp. B506 TaxID=137721 RepID=UPI0009FF6C7B